MVSWSNHINFWWSSGSNLSVVEPLLEDLLLLDNLRDLFLTVHREVCHLGDCQEVLHLLLVELKVVLHLSLAGRRRGGEEDRRDVLV